MCKLIKIEQVQAVAIHAREKRILAVLIVHVVDSAQVHVLHVADDVGHLLEIGNQYHLIMNHYAQLAHLAVDVVSEVVLLMLRGSIRGLKLPVL
jgi:hypothetical protein